MQEETTSRLKAGKIARIILNRYNVGFEWATEYNLFELLVAIVLSQRTYWKNTRKALEEFRAIYENPRDVVKSSIEEIAETIRSAGLHHEKARVLKNLAEKIVNRELVLEEIVNLPYEEARRKLISIKGLGPKTADVFLMIAARQPVVPVDTHISRIARRTGIVREKTGYEEIRRVLEEAVEPELRGRLHVALIMFGRSICRPRNPRCNICPIREYCDYWVWRKAKPGF